MDVITMISNTINIAIITMIAIILSKPLRSSVKVSDVRVKAIQVVVCTCTCVHVCTCVYLYVPLCTRMYLCTQIHLCTTVKVSDVKAKALQVVVCTAQILVSGPHQTPQSTRKKKKQTSQFFNKTAHTPLRQTKL